MNVKRVVYELKEKYPGKRIVVNDDKNPNEVICEIDPASNHPEYSEAIAVIDRIITHYHKKSFEDYEVLRGRLKIVKSGKVKYLNPGQRIRIKPGEYHSAQGKEVWFKVKSTPGWTPDDHFLVE